MAEGACRRVVAAAACGGRTSQPKRRRAAAEGPAAARGVTWRWWRLGAGLIGGGGVGLHDLLIM